MKPDAHVFDGEVLWRLHAQEGIPLEISLMELGRRGYVASWNSLLAAASRDGARWDTLIPRICFAVRESYPAEFAAGICNRLNGYLAEISP